jgi:uncharacterized membrane protein
MVVSGVAVAVSAVVARRGDGDEMVMIRRFFDHVLHAYWYGQRKFPEEARRRIAEAIGRAEQGHAGEICVVIESSLTPMQLMRDTSARERALEVFAEQHVWDTAHNSGLLVYLLLADHAVEILADRGLHPAGTDFWPQAAQRFRQACASPQPTDGCVAAIAEMGEFLRCHLPAQGDNPDELPNPLRLL